MRRRTNMQERGGGAVGAHPEKLRRARMFRQAPTSAEATVWNALRRRFVAGLRFRRQHVIAGYVVDFYCPALRLVIEIDGGIHDEQRERDELRTRHVTQLGARILRIPNERVFSDLVGVIDQILDVSERLRAGLEIDE